MKVENNKRLRRELGLKLRNFRLKLGLAIDEKKINQDVFGEMFGGYTPRQITSYEMGDSPVPSLLLYQIWKSGNSIDAMFSGGGEITEEGRLTGRALYDKSSLAIIGKLDKEAEDRLLKEAKEREKTLKDSADQEDSAKTSTKRKASPGKAGATKKR